MNTTTKSCTSCSDTPVTVTYTPSTVSSQPCTSSCPVCGSLECLCRPRFFDGQLLSADDLTRLENYIVKKNRLHNRYLNDWGVVAGLEVACHPCKDQVVVRQGYAISPCGDDIQVCDDIIVPICDLINQCKPSRSDDCNSAGLTAAEAGCAESTQQWILMICYDEKPSRGITALRNTGGSTSCSKCNCGGSASCGCGCHDQAANLSRSSSRYSPAQCEPSLICEGYRFDVQRITPASRRDQKLSKGAIVDRFLACYRELLAAIPDLPTDLTNLNDLQQYCCDIRDTLGEFFYTHSTYNCLLDERLALVICPSRNNYSSDADYQQALVENIKREYLVVAEYLKYCMCSILLPPVDDPVQENCVPLATITINSQNCHILEVCNLDSRKFAITIPTLEYWMSWLPIGQLLRNAAGKLCCPPITEPNWGFNIGDYKYKMQEAKMSENVSAEKAAPQAAYQKNNTTEKVYATASQSKDTSTIFANAWSQRANSIDLQAMILDAFGATNAQNQPFLTETERRNPLTTLLANQFAVPVVESFMSPSQNISFTTDRANTATANADMETLKAQVTKLSQVVTKQQTTINKLSKKPAAKKPIKKPIKKPARKG